MVILDERDFATTPTPFLRAKLTLAAGEQRARPRSVEKARALFSDTFQAASALWRALNDVQPPEELQDMFNRVEETFDFRDTDRVTDWLRDREIPKLEPIIISWGAEHAIATNWNHFVEGWRYYCVAGSDDTRVAPLSEYWQLQFHHEEAFAFGWHRR